MNLVWIILLFLLGKILIRLVVDRMLRLATLRQRDDSNAARQQAQTLGNVLTSTGNVVVYVVIALMTLNFFGVNITPILASAGVVGIAVGFGAQTLVKDLVSGIFLLLEHRYRLGDSVKIDGFEGIVVRISMRSTVLKSAKGEVFYISNGSIGKVVNLSQSQKNWEEE